MAQRELAEQTSRAGQRGLLGRCSTTCGFTLSSHPLLLPPSLGLPSLPQKLLPAAQTSSLLVYGTTGYGSKSAGEGSPLDQT